MFFKTWEVLVVDDEPDVLSMSQLAMKDFNIYGLPLTIRTAKSKAEALELLRSRPEIQWGLAVAFIDVVMESDTAGLELCQTMRQDMNNKITQIFIRTGQPGIAPERAVIDDYDINGYFTKSEATEEKLYTLVKSSVRQFFWTTISQAVLGFHEIYVSTAGSREKLTMVFQAAMQRLDAGVGEGFNRCYMVDDTIIELNGWDEETARETINNLDQQPGIPLGDNGDKYVMGGDDILLIKASAQPGRSPAYGLLKTEFTPPTDTVALVHRVFSSLGMAWQNAQ